MSETPNTKKPELERGSETLTEDLYALSQESPREFARKWENERDNAKLEVELEDFFREKFVEQGGLDPNLNEMSEENKRMLYSLRAEGNELVFIFNQLGSEARANPAQAESLTRFIKEQDARASQQHDRPPMPGDDYTKWILESFEDASVEASTQAPSAEKSGDIQSRLNPAQVEPLSDAKMSELFRNSKSNDTEKIAAYGEALGQMTQEQRDQFETYKRQSLENERVAAMTPEERKQYFATPIEKENKARQDALEVAVAQEPNLADNPEVVARRENPQTEEDRLLLFSLMLREPEAFKKVYGNLTPAQKAEYDLTQSKQERALEKTDPTFIVPKLSSNGETWHKMSPATVESDVSQRQANPKTPEDFRLLQDLEAQDPERFKSVRMGLTPDQLKNYEAQKKIDETAAVRVETTQAQEPTEIARAYEPELSSRPNERPAASDRAGDVEWANGAKELSRWARFKRRWFGK